MEHACASRHGDAPAAGIAASRRSRRYPKRLRLCMRGLRWPAASCLAGPALQPQMLAAWRRPSRGAPTGPRCPGRMCSGRPYEAADTCCGRARAQRPSGEHGLRGVARAFSCAWREERTLFSLFLKKHLHFRRGLASYDNLHVVVMSSVGCDSKPRPTEMLRVRVAES